MKTIDRRGLMRGILVATAAATGALALMTEASEAMPLNARARRPPAT
jgi:hypothetical protein